MFTQAFSVDVRNAGCDTTDLDMDFQESEQSDQPGLTGDYIEQSVPIKRTEQQPRLSSRDRYDYLRKFRKSYLKSFFKHARMSSEASK
jgi:hypothetical protein